MTLPVSTRLWSTPLSGSVAQQASAGATNRRVLRLLRDDLQAAGVLTLDFECNSTTAGTKGDGVKRINADTDWVGAAPGVAHSWGVDTVVVGAMTGQLCWDRDSSLDGAGSLWWSEAAGFTGGTTTNRPTATDEIEVTSTTNILSTTNGAHTWYWTQCTMSGQEGWRLGLLNAAVASGPVAFLSYEIAGNRPAVWTTGTIVRWMGGAGSFGNRGDWTSVGWMARIEGVVRTLLLDGLAPQAAVDPDGDRLLETSGLVNATIGRVGRVDDWFWQDDAVNALTSYSDVNGVRQWQAFDEIVIRWFNGPDLGGGNIAGAKVNVLYAAAGSIPSPPTITVLSPTPGVQPGDPGGFPISYSAAKDVKLRLRVVDPSPGLRLLVVILRMTVPAPHLNPYPCTMTVYSDAAGGLQLPFDAANGSSVTPIAGGFDLDLVLPEGWPRGAELHGWVHAVDQAGALS